MFAWLYNDADVAECPDCRLPVRQSGPDPTGYHVSMNCTGPRATAEREAKAADYRRNFRYAE